MDSFPTFEQFLTTSATQIPMVTFLIDLLLAAVLAAILGKVYIRYGSALSNRKLFARNFLILTMTVMLIITIVKSSLALSLGLVGALSIVRYRAAIKEPEELGYLFIAISIGLGLGANQRLITLAAFLVIVAIICIRDSLKQQKESPNLHLIVSTRENEKLGLEEIVETLSAYCTTVSLKRFDQSERGLEASFLVEYVDFAHLEESREALKKLDSTLSISLLDNKGLL
ncbi:DUF4956 domain-containing protein [bacterium]|nr:DUF4956 domain-containing protein [bacterium]